MKSATLPAPVLTIIRSALDEDIQGGDLTCEFFVDSKSMSSARILAREPGILAGSEIAARVFQEVDPRIMVQLDQPDGASFSKGDTLLRITGPTRGILSAERCALNFLQRLCGIASLTRRYVDAVKPYPVKVLDTRKTTPGWRWLEKMAVRAGGGTNHRMGLYDRVMVKDNHLLADDRLDDLQNAIDRVKAAHPGVMVELEADTLEQVENFLTLRGADMILLDNMPPAKLREAVTLVHGRIFLEASGGITLETINEVASTGVDAISCGALTHSARALDLSLELE
ncbi:MAG: carboxylating nicotinate-nucleotide diphosphorylase [Verrucomicrobia bacterium]|nr:carboxylating nicotinate-nucleotide diphosphorylase [Verrucomicrobiota bacterium]